MTTKLEQEVQNFCDATIRGNTVCSLLIAPDHFRQQVLLDAVRASSALAGTEWQSVEGKALEKKKLSSLADATANLSLFSSQKGVIVRDASEIPTGNLDAVLGTIESSSESTSWVLISSRKHRSQKLKNFFKGKKSYLELDTLPGKELASHCKQVLEAETGHSVSSNIAQFITAAGEENLDRIASICSSFVLFLGGEKPTLALAKQLLPDVPDPNEFGLLDQLSQRSSAAHENTEEIIREGKNVFQLFGLVSKHYSQIASVKASQSGLRGPDWLRRRIAQNASKYSNRELWHLSRWMLRMDERLKGKSLGTDFELRRFVEEVCNR